MPTGMLPTMNTMDYTRRQQKKKTIEMKYVYYALFLFANVCWFCWTMFYVGKSPAEPSVIHSAEPKDPILLNSGNDYPYGEPLSKRAKNNLPSAQKPADGNPSPKSLIDVDVTGTLNAGGLKLQNNVLSATDGQMVLLAEELGIGTANMDSSDKLVVNGPIRISDGGTRPRCDSNHRGMIWHEFGEIGVPDTVESCVKNKADEYEWRNLATGGKVKEHGGAGPHRVGATGALGALDGDMDDGRSAGALVRTFRVGSSEGIRSGDVVSFVDGKVQRGFGIQYGDPAVFLDSSTGFSSTQHKRHMEMVVLSPSSTVLLHGGGNGPAMAQLGQVSGSTLAIDRTRITFGPAKLEHFTAFALSATRIVIVFANPELQGAPCVVLGEVREDQFEVEKPVPVPGVGPVSSMAAVQLSDKGFALVFNEKRPGQGGHGVPTMMVGQIASEGTSVSFSNSTTLGEHLDGFQMVHLALDRVAVVYRDLRTKHAVVQMAVVSWPVAEGEEEEDDDMQRSVSDASIILGTPLALPTPGRLLSYLQATAMSASRIAVAYADNSEGNVVIVETSGGVLTAGLPVRFSNTKPLSLTMGSLTQSNIMIAYYTNNPRKTVVLKGDYYQGQSAESQSGSQELSFTESVLSEGYSTHCRLSALNMHSFTVLFYDGENDDAGTGVVGMVGQGSGVATGGGTEGEQVPVLFSGVSHGHRGLTVGMCYYASSDGSITTIPTANSVGLAISPNEIFVGAQGC